MMKKCDYGHQGIEYLSLMGSGCPLCEVKGELHRVKNDLDVTRTERDIAHIHLRQVVNVLKSAQDQVQEMRHILAELQKLDDK